MSNQNPLGDRGKAQEDAWARKRDQEAIDAMKKKGQEKPTGNGGADKPEAQPAKKK
ncbi:MAG: hypothetical protein K2Y32_14345 [Candidatus Obscuribacterales bacterium]|jgi:hypothetical protein|nr:hypothetical protein [Candidatus Obscuribacterales bacterium]